MAISKEDILEAVAGMTVMDLNDLVKAFEEKFGVSALLAVAAPAPAVAAAAAEEETEFTVVLAAAGDKEGRSHQGRLVPLPAWASKEAKDLVDGAQARQRHSKADADALKKQLEDAGAKVEIKSRPRQDWAGGRIAAALCAFLESGSLNAVRRESNDRSINKVNVSRHV